MLNFTVGPVMSEESVLAVASKSAPYFRTREFSEIMQENERMVLELMNAPKDSRCVFLTASGTGAMESCVMNILGEDDKVVVINGGSFGQRFVDLCRLHKRDFVEVKCGFGKQLRRAQLDGLEPCTALLINMNETSSGTLYDMKMVSDFCEENGILLIIDAISSFIADELDMEKLGAAAVITGSQKALAVQPGVSLVVLAPAAIQRVENNKEICMYLSLKQALSNGERGQTPFTPAVTSLLQIHRRLASISKDGGVIKERQNIVSIAEELRNSIRNLPFEFVSESPSNAVTALYSLNGRAKEIVEVLKDEYKIWVCPNGGEQAETIFRVGHIGRIRKEDNQLLIEAFHDMDKRGLL